MGVNNMGITSLIPNSSKLNSKLKLQNKFQVVT